jgi:hypothetical protein
VVTRRAALAAGVAALAGCGKDDAKSPPRPPSAADALLRALAAQRAAVAALSGTAAKAQDAVGRANVREIEARAAGRARNLAAAVSAEGGRPHDAPQPAGGSGEPDAALAAQRAALAAVVAALPSLSTRDLRRLGAELVAGTSADAALLADAFGDARAEAFPGAAS